MEEHNQTGLDSLPVDPDEICETAESFFTDDQEKAGNALLILAQADPTAVGSDGNPLFSAAQQTLIVEAANLVDGWRNS